MAPIYWEKIICLEPGTKLHFNTHYKDFEACHGDAVCSFEVVEPVFTNSGKVIGDQAKGTIRRSNDPVHEVNCGELPDSTDQPISPPDSMYDGADQPIDPPDDPGYPFDEQDEPTKDMDYDGKHYNDEVPSPYDADGDDDPKDWSEGDYSDTSNDSCLKHGKCESSDSDWKGDTSDEGFESDTSNDSCLKHGKCDDEDSEWKGDSPDYYGGDLDDDDGGDPDDDGPAPDDELNYVL